MEACSRGFPIIWSPQCPQLTLEEAFRKPVNPISYLVVLLCPRMPQALWHFGETAFQRRCPTGTIIIGCLIIREWIRYFCPALTQGLLQGLPAPQLHPQPPQPLHPALGPRLHHHPPPRLREVPQGTLPHPPGIVGVRIELGLMEGVLAWRRRGGDHNST